MRTRKHHSLLILLIGLLLYSCGSGSDKETTYAHKLEFGPGQENQIEEAFLELKDSTHIHLLPGNYEFQNLSIAQVNRIKITGAGPDKTLLNFKSQTQGGEGIRVTDIQHFVIEDMTIKDSKGDLLKINNGKNIEIRGLHAIWSKADSTSGGYGIYPVLCSNVLIENCYAEGASDAGIYVGQTQGAIVRKSKAYKNVAGCEIENSTDAEVYENEFYGNTAGFLVFDLPDLSQRGGRIKAYNNKIYDNNYPNFAKAGSFGTYWGVGNASPGSGVIILSTSHVSIYNNQITDNNSSAITIASGFAVDEKAAEKINDKYAPIPTHIKIYGNTIKLGDAFPAPAHEHRIGQMLVATENQLNKLEPSRSSKRIPGILYDGINSNILTQGSGLNPDSLCIDQPGDGIFVNADFGNMGNPQNWKPNTNSAPFVCK